MTGKQRSGASRLHFAAGASPRPERAPRPALRAGLGRLAAFGGAFGKVFGGMLGKAGPRGGVLDRYVDAAPSLQNAIDAVPGWTGAMPEETGLVAGPLALHADTRIDWLLRQCFDVAGRTVLELGPLEGFHTAMLERSGAAAIDAIEANTAAFLRCLITKEALRLQRASFFLGDFMKWFDGPSRRYDLVVGSGVLYHSDDPVRLLERLAGATDALYLWTHVFDEAAMPAGDERLGAFSGIVEERRSNGVAVRLHERSYLRAWKSIAFNGGIRDRHFWMERADLLALLGAMGFDRLLVADDEPLHSCGPALSIFAQRSGAGGAFATASS